MPLQLLPALFESVGPLNAATPRVQAHAASALAFFCIPGACKAKFLPAPEPMFTLLLNVLQSSNISVRCVTAARHEPHALLASTLFVSWFRVTDPVRLYVCLWCRCMNVCLYVCVCLYVSVWQRSAKATSSLWWRASL
jgi:hypothetical protein